MRADSGGREWQAQRRWKQMGGRVGKDARLPPGNDLGFGEGLETAWEHSWPWPVWGTIAILLVIAAIVAYLYANERGPAGKGPRVLLATLRITLCAIVLWMSYGWMRHQHRTDLPDVVILIDDSASMATVDRRDEQRPAEANQPANQRVSDSLSRLDKVRVLLDDPRLGYLKRLQGRYRLKGYRVGRTARVIALDNTNSSTLHDPPAIDSNQPASETKNEANLVSLSGWSAEEPATRLGQCVLDVLQLQRGRPTAAIVLLTDGVTTEGRALAEGAAAARRRQIPLYCVGVGSERAPIDIRLSDLLADDVAFVGDLVTFEARLFVTGFGGRSVKARLVRSDRGTVVAEQAVLLPAEPGNVPVRLAFRPTTPGDYPLTMVVESLAGEATTENNRLARRVTVREETLKVLLVQAYPSYEYRYLKTMLQRQLKRVGTGERAIELTTVLQESDPDYPLVDETAARTFPANRDDLFRYDVVIFGDVDPTLLGATAFEHLAAFVLERGGGLIVCTGPRYTPMAYRHTKLAELLPIDLATTTLPVPGRVISDSFQPRLSSLGELAPPMQIEDTPERNAAAWGKMPELYWLGSAPDLRPGARVLLEHPSRTTVSGAPLPVVAVQFVGAGKVVAQLTDETWRWSRTADGEAAYTRYWMQLLRWLSRSRLAAGGRLAQLTADRERYETEDRVELRVRFMDERTAPSADDGVTLMLQRDEAGARSVTLQRDAVRRGVFAASLEPLAEGNYRAWLVAPESTDPPSTRFTVVAPANEQSRLTLNREELREAAHVSGGRYFDLPEADSLPDELPRGQQVRIESLPPQPIWNHWPAPLAVLLLLTGEWLLRKRMSML
ncbi:MAG: hypothetical protein U1A77_05875 [Pirellulales bacterium]